MYNLVDERWIRAESVLTVEIYADVGSGIAYITFPGRELTCKPAEARALLEHLNGSYNDVPTPPAADFVLGKMRHITQVEKFISRSGNESWKAESDEVVVYFRQVQKELLKEAGLWDDLNDMYIGETLPCNIVLYTVPDGDLHKIVRIEPGGMVFGPEEDEDIEDDAAIDAEFHTNPDFDDPWHDEDDDNPGRNHNPENDDDVDSDD